jgi:hypothetical protein
MRLTIQSVAIEYTDSAGKRGRQRPLRACARVTKGLKELERACVRACLCVCARARARTVSPPMKSISAIVRLGAVALNSYFATAIRRRRRKISFCAPNDARIQRSKKSIVRFCGEQKQACNRMKAVRTQECNHHGNSQQLLTKRATELPDSMPRIAVQ